MDGPLSYEALINKVNELEQFKTTYMQAERERKKVEDKSRAWLDNSPVCTKMVDLELNLQYMSAAGIKGLQIDDVTSMYGKPYPFSFYPESFKRQMTKNLKKAIARVQTVSQEGGVTDIEGNQIWFQSTIVPVKDQQGRIEYLMVISIDITDRKRLERASYDEQLEFLVEQRVTQLHQSQKMESLGTFAGGIAHDFNNILAAILGQGELCLAQLPQTNIATRYVQSIVKSGNRASDLVRQIMMFSRNDTRGFKQLNLSHVVGEALKKVRSISPANIEIRQDLSEHCLVINADETQIHQVVHHLCSNANHAMGASGGVLEITLTEEYLPCSIAFSEPKCLRLTVKDSGKGMTPQQQQQVFDPFFTTKEAGKGTGLGLSVVHGIMRSHHGKISVESELDKGTIFTLLFPISKDEIQPLSRKSLSLSAGSGHILVVEDEATLTCIYQEFLQQFNYSVTTASNGVDALSKLKQSPNAFDLVITDHFMPKMTGKQLIPKLLAIRPDIPIILTTGSNDLMSQEQAKALGISKFLSKPLRLPQLKDCIDECLGA